MQTLSDSLRWQKDGKSAAPNLGDFGRRIQGCLRFSFSQKKGTDSFVRDDEAGKNQNHFVWQTIRTTLDFAKSTISGNKRFDKLCWKPSSGYWLGMLLSYRMRGNTKNAGIDWKRKGVMLQMTAERRKKEAAWESAHKTVCMHRLKQGNCHMDCNGKRIRCRGLLSAFSTPRETIGERFFALCISDLSFVMADMFMCLALVDLYFLSLTHVLFPLSG